MDNNQKVVWITGASSGIGEEIAYEYARMGFQIVVSARRKEALIAVKNNCVAPNKVLVLPLDLTKPEDFESKTQEVISQFGRIDILVNNGGISQRSPTSETALEIDRKVMEVNYFGNIGLTKAVLPIFKKQKTGHIIAVSSLTGIFGFYLRSAYAASKHALHGFYESLLLEEEKNGLKVTIVCPGFINTDISKNALNASGKSTGEMDENQAKGMSPQKCAVQIIRAQQKNIREIVIGKEKYGVMLRRFLPSLFWSMLKKRKAQ